MILLFTDFGCQGPYLGQMEFVLRKSAPDVEVINLVSDAPARNPRPSAYLLAALSGFFAKQSIFLCVVDPGVGGNRLPIVLKADGKWFLGPDNGLLNTVALHADQIQWWTIEWRPENLSASFHGRDLFAPMAAQIGRNDDVSGLQPYAGPDLTNWPEDVHETIYIDHYGNVVTGLRYNPAFAGKMLIIDNHEIAQSDTFSSVPEGQAFWYQNSSGLVEIAVNQEKADKYLGLSIGKLFCFR